MKDVIIGQSSVKAPAIIQGCMRIGTKSIKELEDLISTQLENGVSFFDHADIYGKGKCEELFGEVLKATPSLRDKIQLQTKCAIRPGKYTIYDFSKEHIIKSVEGSLKRLKTDYVDYLLLHRPDTLMEPEEVAEAFDLLYSSGKVRHFGVSNHTPMQIELLKNYVNQPIEINQMQFSIMHTGMIDSGFNSNTREEAAVNRDGYVLDYCRLKGITLQCWSPFQYGMFQGVFLGNEKFPEVNRVISKLMDKYKVTDSAIAVAWLLRHPANMQVVVGSTNINRLKAINKAAEIKLTREEWYEIYAAAGNRLP